MKVAIRMIGIATMIFWIFLIIFFATALYSTKDLRFSFGEPQLSTITENEIVFSVPVTIANHGFYDIHFFNAFTEIYDSEGTSIARSHTYVPLVRSGEEINSTNTMTIDLDDLLKSDQNLLFNDTTLSANAELSMSIAGLIPVQASTNLSTPWGAPFYNFRLGAPEIEAFNLTHLRVVVPIDFENHASFDIAGAIEMRMYNNADLLTGESQAPIDVSQYSSFDGHVEFYVLISELTSNGRFEVSFVTSMFSYGPVVCPYG